MSQLLKKYPTKTTAIVVTTAMLTFVSHWRAASVILCDLGSSAFYACGIAEQAIGKAAPWFVIAIICLSWCVRSVYSESCAMFVRGGVYKVVKHALGGSLAKISVSALLFDYLLTGPISAVSAGHYLGGFINQLFGIVGLPHLEVPRAFFATMFAAFVIIYFWRKNVMGIEESSGKSLRIVQLSSITIAVLFIWSIITILTRHSQLPPITPHPTAEALGWLQGFSWAKGIGAVGIFIALGHSLLAMSGEESLAQLYRELASPKIKNLRRAAVIIFVFTFIFTGLISLFSVMIIPDSIRPNYYDNLIAGLSMHLVGPETVKVVLHGLVVLVGALLLSGAVNTSIVGANGALCRLSEDGIFSQWFRVPHKRFGTTHRFITTLAVMQVAVVLICRGDVYLLGEAYAFGVVWSFVSQTASVLALRWKDRSHREYMVPYNIKVGNIYVPIGIGVIFLVLLGIAIANFFTKTIATKFGILFTVIVFIILRTFEYINKRRPEAHDHTLEMVNIKFHDTASSEICGCKHENVILVAARDPNNLSHLKEVLQHTDLEKTDVVVMTIRQGPLTKEGTAEDLPYEEKRLLTNIITVAEKYGRNLIPIVVPSQDPMYAIAKAAYDLNAKEVVFGKSQKTGAEIQLEKFAMAWGYVSADAHRKVVVRVVWPGHELKYDVV